MDTANPDLAQVHLELELGWLFALLGLRLRELQAAGVLPAPSERFPGTAIAPQEVEARFRAFGSATPDHKSPAERQALEELARAANAREALRREHADALRAIPLETLRARLRLDDDEYLLLLVALAPEFDPGFARIYGYLQNHFERQYASLALVAETLARGRPARVRKLLRADRPLMRYGLLNMGVSDNTSSMHASLTVDPRIVKLISGDQTADGGLDAFTTLSSGRPLGSMILPTAIEARVRSLAEQFRQFAANPWDLPVVVLTAPEGSGKRHLAAILAEMSAAPGSDDPRPASVLTVDLLVLLETPEQVEAGLRMALREALILNALTCITGGEALAADPLAQPGAPETRVRESARRLVARLVRQHEGAVVITATSEVPPRLESLRVVEYLTWRGADESHSARLWDAFLPARIRGEGATPAELARRFDLTPGQMLSVLRVVQTRSGGRRLTGDAIQAEVRAQVLTRLGESAHLVSSNHTWSDLVVSDDVRTKLKELVSRYRHSHIVAKEWGLARRFGAVMGLSVLFAGTSGTGKTMAAGIIAKELGLDLFQVDLSRIVSKWLGETEKALSKIFDEAERVRAILLFDEADSLFAKRTSVESSHDRYANLEVNYLLQRIERFQGVAILTTNFPDSLDQAFKRRLSAQITFTAPDATQRERLWKTLLDQPGLKREPDIRFDILARQFELAGGLIKNAVLRAVFLAVAEGTAVSESLLSRAATAEMTEQGMLVRSHERHRA